MGEIADSMINGEICSQCGVYLEPKEKVYCDDELVRMPVNGEGFGCPVICQDCYPDYE